MKRTLFALAAWLCLTASLFAWETKSEPVLPDGRPVALILPPSEHMMNTGGSDGSGLCVYTAVTLAADFQNVPEAKNLRKFAEGRPGGSYPEKLAADLKTYAQRYGVTLPNYVQHTGGDEAFLDLCIATRRMPGITYAGKDDFYDGPILHMVNLANLDKTYGTIQDNNRAGKWTTDTRQKLIYRWKGLDDNGKDLLVPVRQGLRTVWVPAGGGWAFCWLSPPPPPKPPGASAGPAGPEKPCEKCGHWERFVFRDVAEWRYWLNGDLIGKFRDGKWYECVNGDFAEEPSDPPAGLSPPKAEPTDDWNKGVESWKFDRRNRYWINEIEVTQAKAYAAVADPQGLVDDSDRYHLSIVGYSGVGEKAGILKKFAPGGAFEKYARRLHVQVYAATDWPAKDILHSVVTLQEPAKIGGKIVGLGGDWTDKTVGKVLGDVFDPPTAPTPPPAPKPAPTPDTKPDPAPAPDVKPDPTPADKNWWWVALAALLALIYKGKSK